MCGVAAVVARVLQFLRLLQLLLRCCCVVAAVVALVLLLLLLLLPMLFCVPTASCRSGRAPDR